MPILSHICQSKPGLCRASLADLIANFYSELGLQEQLRALARDIGSTRLYVAQLLTTLNLYDHAKNAKFYGLQKIDEGDIRFSLLSTALSYAEIVSFLGLTGRDAVTLDGLNDKHAKDLLAWMFVQDQGGYTILGESRHLKKVAAVVASPQAVAELRSSKNLEQAYGTSQNIRQLPPLNAVDDCARNGWG